ncbi:Cellulosome-anchoring protein [Proteiniborus sp. DW1]|uniref:S-layer homology domain-containing protein n=1 Tax=Proteiniborus sp. DW1 TaxID=1889883 RepID=UPI00092DF52C|nr:S-layer homology domain-containing protein [Proteiniborus sp. DW1]SCG82668.1 Cellulosome-anchoring protein [Proteiniborus sp. DW1]
MKIKKIIITIFTCLLLLFSINITHARIYFYDVFGHWAEDAIMWGANTTKLLNGYEDGTFKPDGNISRAEYVSLLYRTAKKQGMINDQLPMGDWLAYKDVEKSFWAYDHISKIKSFVDNENSYVKFKDIFPGDNFFPNEKITREEAAALTYFFTSTPVELRDISFTDIDTDYKYIDQITALARNKIIFGNPDGTFRPKSNITRAETVTIIKRLYKDMEYHKKSYLGDIKLIESDNTFLVYPLFGDYVSRKLDTNDLLYKRAIETLEYKSLVGIIPFEEQHLYDSDPIRTIEELKKNDYSNVIGVNYYLIESESKIYNDKTQLAEDILYSYLNGASISDDELLLIFQKIFNLVKDTDLTLKALEQWENSATSEKASNNALFMRSKAYMIAGNANEAIKLYENINSSDPSIRMLQLMNYGHILITSNKYNEAENVLREGWEQIKSSESYKVNSRKFDEQFIGALKEVLRLKQIN